MTIDKSLLRKIAQLAQLDIVTHNEAALLEDLGKIVTWMEKLKELDTVGISPLYTVHWEPNVLQEDTPQASLACEKGLANAPSKDSNYFRVPKVKE